MARWARDANLERQWRRRLKEWAGSGLSGREFCVQHSLSEPSFYAWRREIARRDGEPGAARRQEPVAAKRQPAFVPVRVVAGEAIEVVVRSGQVVRVGVAFEAAHLRAVVAALEASAC